MRPVSPVIPTADEAKEIIYAKNQPEFVPLPSLRSEDGIVLSRWLLTADECKQIAEQGYLYVSVQVNMQPTVYQAGTLQPMLLSADVPETFSSLVPKDEQWQEEFEEL